MKWDYQFDDNLITPRNHRTLKGKLMREMGHLHKDVTLMKHFSLGASQRYGYAKRTKRYMMKKAAIMHHQIPLVFTGVLKSVVRLIGKVEATADFWRYTAKSYFPMKEELKREIEIILPEEAARYCRWLARSYVDALPKYARKRSRRKSP